ncbi:MAG: hypothetical protein LBU64_07325 [Planctomycetota bacterium]|jgi:hypothetical protein|nr:hypothetical protein [Planctomycetota bacterium]
MDVMSIDVWREKGSSVVFDREALSSLLAAGDAISLRQALSWLEQSLPADPPERRESLLISGLETVLQVLSPPEAYDFLIYRVRPVIRELQAAWPACGLVFRFASPGQAFAEGGMNDEVLFRRRDQQTVRLSDGLWDGGATIGLKRIVRATEQGGEETLGYHVARIS